MECTYKFHNSKRKVITREAYENLKAKVRELEGCVQIFKNGSSEEVMTELRRLRSLPEGMADDPGSENASQDAWESESEGQNQILTLPETDSFLYLELYHGEKLPPREDVQAAIAALNDPAASLFFVLSPEDGEELLERLYASEPPRVGRADLCALCAFAALGRYLTNPKSERSRQTLFRTAMMLVDECCELDSLQTLRAILSLSLFTLVEKKSGVRVSLASGLQIARWVWQNENTTDFNSERHREFRKLYRSLIVLESFLANKFAFHSTVSEHEMEVVIGSELGRGPSEADTFAVALYYLAHFTKNVATDVRNDDRYSFELVNDYMQQLSTWYDALPENARLASLNDTQHVGSQDGMWTAILYMHETFLSIVIELHRKLIPPLLGQRLMGQGWSIDGSVENANDCYSRTMLAAQQCVRVNSLLTSTTGAVFRRCWLLLCESFVCILLLLADAALSFLTQSHDGMESKLSRIGDAVESLIHMREIDGMVVGFLKTLTPLLQELRSIQEARSKVEFSSPPNPRTLLEYIIEVLKHINRHQSAKALANAASSRSGSSDWWKQTA